MRGGGKNVNLYYFAARRNFGDDLGPIILERIFNVPTQSGTKATADLVALGSLLDLFLWKGRNYPQFLLHRLSSHRRPLHVFGTGFIREPYFFSGLGYPKTEYFFRKLKVHAVRGKLTRARIEPIGVGGGNDIALGDPGILASLLIDKPVKDKHYSLGIIPHYVDEKNELLLRLHDQIPNSIIINVADDPFRVLETMTRCDAVASTAMHGLIVADSLGIPNGWVRVSDKILGGNYKFRDYYSVYDINEPHCFDLRQQATKLDPQLIADNYRVENNDVMKIQENLLRAFPEDLY